MKKLSSSTSGEPKTRERERERRSRRCWLVRGATCLARTAPRFFPFLLLFFSFELVVEAMGVQGLWTLLEPVGKRVNVETLQNRKVAVDASIWLIQFLSAMRDEKGELIRNAHVMGFFRRICRLLFHKIRPVFVFDGATPVLKQATVAARRRRREQHGKVSISPPLNPFQQQTPTYI